MADIGPSTAQPNHRMDPAESDPADSGHCTGDDSQPTFTNGSQGKRRTRQPAPTCEEALRPEEECFRRAGLAGPLPEACSKSREP